MIKPKIHIAPIFGAGYSQFKLNDKTKYSRFKYSGYYLTGGIALSSDLNRLNERISLQFDLLLNRYDLKGEGEIVLYENYISDFFELQFKNYFIMCDLIICFSYPKGELRPGVYAGFSNMFLINSTSEIIVNRFTYGEITDTYAEEYNYPNRKPHFGFTTGLSLKYHLRHDKILFFQAGFERLLGIYSPTENANFYNYIIRTGFYF